MPLCRKRPHTPNFKFSLPMDAGLTDEQLGHANGIDVKEDG